MIKVILSTPYIFVYLCFWDVEYYLKYLPQRQSEKRVI